MFVLTHVAVSDKELCRRKQQQSPETIYTYQTACGGQQCSTYGYKEAVFQKNDKHTNLSPFSTGLISLSVSQVIVLNNSQQSVYAEYYDATLKPTFWILNVMYLSSSSC